MSIISIPYNLPIGTVKASAFRDLPRIAFFVMTVLAFIQEALRVEADVRIVAVLIIEPDGMVNYLPRLITTDLTQPAIYCHSIIYESLPCFLPGLAFIELLLVHPDHSYYVFPPTHRASLSYTDTI